MSEDVTLTEFERGALADAHAAMLDMIRAGVRGYTLEIVVTAGDCTTRVKRAYRRRVRSDPARYTSM